MSGRYFAVPGRFPDGWAGKLSRHRAGVAQLVEHLICNQRVGGSNPFASSIEGKCWRSPKGGWLTAYMARRGRQRRKLEKDLPAKVFSNRRACALR